MERMVTGSELSIEVTYVGPSVEGEAFRAAIIGAAEDAVGGLLVGDDLLLPMSSSGINILPKTSAEIMSRPQSVAFAPTAIVVGGHPDHWDINDIKIGNRSQLAQGGDISGALFAAGGACADLRLDIVHPGMDICLLVTYVGPEEAGEPFTCAVTGATELKSAPAGVTADGLVGTFYEIVRESADPARN
jgi:hypothetical protein